jgi:hypothetical protein
MVCGPVDDIAEANPVIARVNEPLDDMLTPVEKIASIPATVTELVGDVEGEAAIVADAANPYPSIVNWELAAPDIDGTDTVMLGVRAKTASAVIPSEFGVGDVVEDSVATMLYVPSGNAFGTVKDRVPVVELVGRYPLVPTAIDEIKTSEEPE